jgi:hypothetical protein
MPFRWRKTLGRSPVNVGVLFPDICRACPAASAFSDFCCCWSSDCPGLTSRRALGADLALEVPIWHFWISDGNSETQK